jgi:hypothetical protein
MTQDLNDRMQRFGHEAQAAGSRLSSDPAVVAAGTWASRAWGLVLIVIGLWLFAQVTLGLDLPEVDWNLVWPVGLMLVGGFVVVSALARRR